MRQSKFTETQIVSILKEADAGRPVNEIRWKYGLSSATYYRWKASTGGWRPPIPLLRPTVSDHFAQRGVTTFRELVQK
jgi:hypothetical protein